MSPHSPRATRSSLSLPREIVSYYLFKLPPLMPFSSPVRDSQTQWASCLLPLPTVKYLLYNAPPLLFPKARAPSSFAGEKFSRIFPGALLCSTFPSSLFTFFFAHFPRRYSYLIHPSTLCQMFYNLILTQSCSFFAFLAFRRL